MKITKCISLLVFNILILFNCSQLFENGEGPLSFLPAVGLLPDSNPPTVLNVVPINESTNVPENTDIFIQFSREMNQTATESGFSLRNANETVDGVFDWLGPSVIFKPKNPLNRPGVYSITLSSFQVESREGANLVFDFNSTFTVNSDSTQPIFISSIPSNGNTGVPRDTRIIINFSKPINIASFWNGISSNPDIGIDIPRSRVENGGTQFILELTGLLEFATTYSINLPTSIVDLSGNQLLQNYQINFTVGDDFDKPELVSIETDSVNNFINLENSIIDGFEKNESITIQFSEPVLPSSVRDGISFSPNINFRIDDISADSSRYLIIPDTPFDIQTIYQLNVSDRILDLQENNLIRNYNFSININGERSRYLWVRNVYTQNDFSSSVNPNIINILSPPDGGGGPTNYDFSLNPNGFFIEFCRGETLATCDILSNPRDLNIILLSLQLSVNFDFGPISGSPYFTIPTNITPLPTDQFIFRTGINSLAPAPSTYIFTIQGGTNGVRDEYENYMKEEYRFRFRIEP